MVLAPFLALGAGMFFTKVFQEWIPLISNKGRQIALVLAIAFCLSLVSPTAVWGIKAVQNETAKHYGSVHVQLINDVATYVRQHAKKQILSLPRHRSSGYYQLFPSISRMSTPASMGGLAGRLENASIRVMKPTIVFFHTRQKSRTLVLSSFQRHGRIQP